MEKLVLIDGNSLINRAFYAMPVLTTKEGIPTNAVYGFMNMFFKMLGEIKPTYVAVAFDLKAPTFRHKAYSEYKATRKPMPEELRPQIPLLKELLAKMGVCTIEKEGFEADDIIGTVAKHTSIPTYIYTGDRDSFQLVDNETTVYFTKRGITDVDVLDINNFKEKTGIEPLQIIDLKALMGDSSDNIPGVPGVGEKTALNLVQTYGSVENIYQNIEEIKGKLKEKLEQGKDLCFTSKMLATIEVDAPVLTDTSKMVVPYVYSSEVKKEFIRLEFKSLIKREDLFLEDTISHDTPTCQVVKIDGDFELKDLSLGKKVVVLVDTDRICVSDGKTEYQISTVFNLLEGISEKQALLTLKDLFNGDKELILFDGKELRKKILRVAGFEFDAFYQDLSIIKYLADYTTGGISVADILDEYGLDKSTPATSLLSLYNTLYQKLKEEEMEDLYLKVELPLSNVLYQMEKSGFKVDIDKLTETGVKYRSVLDGLESEIRQETGEENLNVNSPKQLGEVLFEKLKIGKGKKTKSGYSTSAEVLEEYAISVPVVAKILRYRQIQKLYSTYIEGFKPLIDKQTGLIHTSFNQTVTATGRLSSSEPNLQNIPVRDDEGKELRKFFVPKSSDRILVGADYSQIELRLLAGFSGSKPLIDAFNRGDDIHSETASKVFNVDIKDVTSQMRRNAKAVNFGVIYGISEYGLAKNLKISPAQAREYISSYFATYPEVKNYLEDCKEQAKKTGYAITFLKRRRYIRELLSSSFPVRQFGERVAMNMPLQGSAADLIKVAMINVYNRLKKEGLKSELILQVHDELIVDALKEEQDLVEKILREEMENAVKLNVMLTVDVGVGETWFDAKQYEEKNCCNNRWYWQR